jgi:hypothetical protein
VFPVTIEYHTFKEKSILFLQFFKKINYKKVLTFEALGYIIKTVKGHNKQTKGDKNNDEQHF